MGNSKNVFVSCFINAAAFLTAILIFIFVVSAGEINYIYDDIGRLIKTIDDQGNEAIYTYDAVGNLLSISGTSTTDSVAIVDISPWEGSDGTIVTIYGKGFSSIPAENIVLFNGISAIVASSTLSAITTSVPAGAATGRVTVQTPLGSAMSAKDFNVVQAINIAISPSFAFLAAGRSQQFTATVTGTSNTSVTWSVEGIEGGTTGIGTISADGLYTATLNTERLDMVTIAARSNTDYTKVAEVPVYLNIERGISNSVSIGFPKPPQLIQQGTVLSSSVSIVVQQPQTLQSGLFLSAGVSIMVAPLPQLIERGPILSPYVSVGVANGQVNRDYGPVLSQEVSITIEQ